MKSAFPQSSEGACKPSSSMRSTAIPGRSLPGRPRSCGLPRADRVAISLPDCVYLGRRADYSLSLEKRLVKCRAMINGSSNGVGSIERPAGWNLLSLVLVVGILLAPSVWMLATVAPLWKDVDAYAQVTAPPGVETILLYCPAYCFLARLPLYCGYLYHCWHAGLGLPSFAFFVKPRLSDAGVFLLLLAQHLAFCASRASCW